ncbi:MAG: biopolymer transporter ExbD [Deltaproteobacteria bacterium]|nr:biopolymer transporter ExbD [Deltaproteobacteria bacterium]
MAFRRFRKNEEEGINTTPLVDVMFNLLIFIIITAQYSNIQSLKVNLPKAQSGTGLEKTEQIVLTLTRDEKIYLNDKPVIVETLKEQLQPFAKKEDQPRVILQADEGSTTGGLVRLMDIASQVGLKKISIETRK